MTRESTPENTFVIGLAMAGAISAGAYTAGVLDTLFRALDAHERKFQSGHVDHRVIVKAMSGASAGSICAALSIVSLMEGIRRHDPSRPGLPGLETLYDLWVNRMALYREDKDSLLGLDDDAGDTHVASILDYSHVEKQAHDLVADVESHPDPLRNGYIAANLDIFLTTTNLMGVPYKVVFGSSGNADGQTFAHEGHVMSSHGDMAHFKVTGLGSEWKGTSPWVDAWHKACGDEVCPTDRSLVATQLIIDPDSSEKVSFSSGPWAVLLDTALASSAFPVGLASRRMEPTYASISCRAWPIEGDPKHRPRPLVEHIEKLPYIAVDGGVANNEPFEYARFAIRKKLDDPKEEWRLASNPRHADDADRAVIMIDPFPEGPEMSLASDDAVMQREEAGLMFVIRKLLPSLINQARFKPLELMAAIDSSIHSRFLIAPSRRLRNKAKLRGSKAIASGFLGGFGGFFTRSFREHDYRLGQENCRSFLANYFVISKDNNIVAPQVQKDPGALKQGLTKGMIRIVQFEDSDLPRFSNEDRVFDPVYTSEREPIGPEPALTHPDAPTLSAKEFIDIAEAAHTRIENVAQRFMSQLGLGKLEQWLVKNAWFGKRWWISGQWMIRPKRDQLSGSVLGRILGEIISRDQFAPTRFSSKMGIDKQHARDDRAIAAAFARQGMRPLSVEEICEHSQIDLPTKSEPRATYSLLDGCARPNPEDQAKAIKARYEKIRDHLEVSSLSLSRKWGSQKWEILDDWAVVEGIWDKR